MKVLGHPGLRQKSLPAVWDKLPIGLLNGMIDILSSESPDHKTTGLSACQVDNNVRMFVMVNPRGHGYDTILNPTILSRSMHKTVHVEGCTSVPNIAAFVSRPHSISVEYTSRHGRQVRRDLTGMWARTFQHEYDHLEGILMVDRVADHRIDLVPIPEVLEALRDPNSRLWQRISPENRGDLIAV